MDIAYVCEAGHRRSVALSLLTKMRAPELTTASCAYSEEKLERDAALRDERLTAIERGWGVDYAREVALLRTGPGNIHPRFGVLLLRRGIEEVIWYRSSPLSETIPSSDLVLAINRKIADGLAERFPGKRVQTVLGYLGSEGDLQDIKNYALPFVRYQLSKDSKQLDELDEIAKQVIAKKRQKK